MQLSGSRAIVKKLFITLFLLVLLFATVKILAVPAQKISPPNSDYLFIIKKGSTFNDVIEKMDSVFNLNSLMWTKIYYKIKGAPNIKAGRYDLSVTTSIQDLIQRFVEGDVKKYKFTIIEGSVAKQALEKLNNLLIENDFERELTASIKNTFSQEAKILPETYIFSDIEELESIFINYQDYLKRYLENIWASKPKSNPLKSKMEALVLASIIEREAVLVSEKSKIASVFLYRLIKGMRLQADPTSAYGYYGDYKQRIGRKVLDDNNEYNTYRISGLPPRPICFPSKSSIEAAIKSIPGDYLYFVAKGDGSHEFSKTLEDHNKAVKKFISGK